MDVLEWLNDYGIVCGMNILESDNFKEVAGRKEWNKDSQLTNTVVMVSPDYFGFNPETGLDNIFQHEPTASEKEVRDAVLGEFNGMVESLEKNNMQVVVLNSPLGPNGELTPDAVFPNNWFSTHPNKLVLYPMKAQNRRWERQPDKLKEALLGVNVLYPETLDLTDDEQNGFILEGTGSLVLDRKNMIAYALESQRTSLPELKKWAKKMGYSSCFFNAVDFGGKPVYHTNVVMSVGNGMAVVCSEAIQSADEREMVIKKLKDSNNEVVEITMEQMYEMCGNILQTVNTKGEDMIVLSERALKAFSHDNQKVLERNGLLVPVKINMIETVGGGSARCMMAEIFN